MLDSATGQTRATYSAPPEATWCCLGADGVRHSAAAPCPPWSICSCVITILPLASQVKHHPAPPILHHTLKLKVTFCVRGVLSPVLANVVLDELDWELDRRGHRFARYADDCNIVVGSARAGVRVMASVKRFIEGSLRLTVNTRKSAVDHPWNRKFLGFTVSRNEAKLKVADQAIEKLKARIRELTRRTRGHRLLDVVAELRETLLGWKAYFGIAEVLSPLRDIDKWIRRKLRCYHWKQWGRAGYRELRRRGVSVREAWHTSKSAHGPWRLSQTPALALALTARYFSNLGLPSLAAR